MSDEEPDMGSSPGEDDPRVFLPSRALQGSDLPLHITWSEGEFQGLEIRGLHEVVEEHNVSDLEVSEESVSVSNIRYPGYIGLVFSTQTLEDAQDEIEVSLEVQVSGETTERTESIFLYRPDVRVSSPDSLAISVSDEQISAGGQLEIGNRGKGSAILKVEVIGSESGESLLREPYEIEEFREGMRADLESRLPTIIESHPGHKSILEKLPSMFFQSIDLEEGERLEALDDYLSSLVVAMENDPALGDDLSSMMAWAFTNNLELVTIIDQFVDYMEAVGRNKIYLTNPIDSLEVEEGTTQVDIRLTATDRAFNEYAPVEVQGLEISATESAEIPIHRLVSFEGDNDG